MGISIENGKITVKSTLSTDGDEISSSRFRESRINDAGQLIVYVTDNVQRPAVLSDNANVVYEPCTYSYNELLSVMDTLNNYKFSRSNDAIASNFNEFGLYDSENRIIVKLDDLSDESIKKFKENVCDSAVIKFEQGCTYNRTTIASCQATQQSGNADAAFCAITNSNYSPTNTLSGTSNTLSTTISEPGVGTVINKIGMKTGHTSGKVLSTNVTITFSSGATISNLTSADYESAPGDSGCVVYSYIGSTGARLTLGIHTGASGSGTRYYTKANEVNAALGTSRY